MSTTQTIDCENLVQNSQILDKNNVCSKLNENFGSKLNEKLIKLNSDIVFNNQTNKLLKQVVNCDSSTPVMGKYNLRKKSVQTRSDSIKKQQTDKLHLRGLNEDSKPKKRNSQLSRYKRKNANARERNRVQALNDAFKVLRSKLLSSFIQIKSADKTMTKIETLRNASTYIASLSKILGQKDEKCIEMNSDAINNLNSDELSNDTQKIDALPDISFIDELSSLSFISNEENQFPNESMSPVIQNDTQKNYVQPKLHELFDSSPINYEEDKTVFSIDQSSNNSQINQSNDSTIVLGNSQHNQTYSIQSSISDSHNFIQNNQPVQMIHNCLPVQQSTNLESEIKTNHLIDSNNNNQFINFSRTKNGLVSFTPLIDKSNDYQPNFSPSLLFSPIKFDDYSMSNYCSIKNCSNASSNDDCFLNCLDDIENTTDHFTYTTTLTRGDDFDMII